MMMVSLFAKSMPKYLDEWEKLTGIKVKTIEYGYTDIPSKIMADAVAKSGQYDIYNHQMYMLPDAADAEAIVPLDDYAARGKPYFDDIPKTLRTEMYYKGKLYTFFTDGDQTIMVLRKDILELPEAQQGLQGQVRLGARLPRHLEAVGAARLLLQRQEGDELLRHDPREGPLRRPGVPGPRVRLPLVAGPLPLQGQALLRPQHEAAHRRAGGGRDHQGAGGPHAVDAQRHLRLGHAAELSVLRPGQLVLHRHLPLDRRATRRTPRARW